MNSQWSRLENLPNDNLPQFHRELLSIEELREKEPSSLIDIAAVVFDVGPLQVINCQDGRTRAKRNITLIDETRKQVSLGLWPDFTDKLNDCEEKAVIFQNLQTREYLGKVMLSTRVNTIIATDETNETVQHLERWFLEHGCENDYEEL